MDATSLRPSLALRGHEHLLSPSRKFTSYLRVLSSILSPGSGLQASAQSENEKQPLSTAFMYNNSPIIVLRSVPLCHPARRYLYYQCKEQSR